MDEIKMEEGLVDDIKVEEEEDMEDVDKEQDRQAPVKKQVYVPGKSKLGKGETADELEYDPSAYRFLHRFTTEHPCLSLDTLDLRSAPSAAYPLSLTFVAGTQAEQTRKNAILVARLANLHGRPENADDEDDEDDSSSSDEDEDEEDADAAASASGSKKPKLSVASIPHHGGVNRLRATCLAGEAWVAAVWNEAGKVQLWNLAAALGALDAPSSNALKKEKPLYTFPGHQVEGFALDWSSSKEGRLASGDNRGRIFTWDMAEGASWSVNQLPLTAHTSSVEDIQWSPTEDNVLASCSSDKSIRLWDVRLKPREANVVTVSDAHESDVNVVSWNGPESLLLTGGDDGLLKVWELGALQYGEAAAVLSQHTGPVTSVAWCPGPEGGGTVLAAAGEDDQVSIWDIAVEPDTSAETEEEVEVPPQLLFLHMGQKEIKELAWARDATGSLLTTALDGFNFFRTISV